MNKSYLQLLVENINSEQAEILIAQLSELPFEGFEETADSLIAFVNEADFDQVAVDEIFDAMSLSYTTTVVAETNWNEKWEKNFDPVVVGNFAAVRAHFHEPIKNVKHEIIITPKMSFGTGHHETTFMMMQQMQHIDFKDKTVFDFGTGTGILSILAEMLGAAEILAIDNDEWSIENALENIETNNCSHIKIRLDNKPPLSAKFNIILANINKYIILEHIKHLTDILSKNGLLLVSGLLIEDEPDILRAASELYITHIKTVSKNKWLCILLTV